MNVGAKLAKKCDYGKKNYTFIRFSRKNNVLLQ